MTQFVQGICAEGKGYFTGSCGFRAAPVSWLGNQAINFKMSFHYSHIVNRIPTHTA